MTADPSNPNDGRDLPPDDGGPPPTILIDLIPRQSPLKPEIVAGGVLGICAHAYLWGTVFVTLFKRQPPVPSSQAAQEPETPSALEPTADAPTSPGSGGGATRTVRFEGQTAQAA